MITQIVSATRTSIGPDADMSVSQFPTSWTLVLEILQLTGSNPAARISFEYSSDGFSTMLPGPDLSITGLIGLTATKRMCWKVADFPGLPIGEAGVRLRTNLQELDGTSPSIQYRAWIES